MTRTQVIDQAIGEIAKNNNKEEYEVTALEVTNFLAEQIVEQSEQLKDEVFTLANKLAVAGEGDAAVAMHRIHNSL